MPKNQKEFDIGDICWVRWNNGAIVQGVIIDFHDSELGVRTALGKDYYSDDQMYRSETQAKSVILKRALNLAKVYIAQYNRIARKQKKPYIHYDMREEGHRAM